MRAALAAACTYLLSLTVLNSSAGAPRDIGHTQHWRCATIARPSVGNAIEKSHVSADRGAIFFSLASKWLGSRTSTHRAIHDKLD
jgi:hypothetical protein